MSGESSDSEFTLSENTSRSRSLLRQVRASLTSKSSNRHRTVPTGKLLSLPLLGVKHKSSECLDTHKLQPKSCKKTTLRASTPTAYSHRLSLLNQVKLHLIGPRKYRQTVRSVWNNNDNYQSLLPIITISETKSSSAFDGNGNFEIDGADPYSSDPFANENLLNGNTTTMMSNGSLDLTQDINENQAQTLGKERTSSLSRLNFNKFKDQITHRARTAITKAPSLTTVLMNSSPTNNIGQIYWTEVNLERGKDLAVKDVGGSSDPYVKVVYGSEEKYTSETVLQNLNPVWNEKFTFFTEDLNTPLYFNIYDHDRIGRDEAMGTAKLDLWKLPVERLYTATLELENEKRNDGRTGSLKIGITLTPKSAEFRDGVLRSLSRQANIKPSGGRPGNNSVVTTRRTIDIFVIEGRKLTAVGVNKTCSPYIKLKFGSNKKFRTQTIKHTLNPKWHQSFMYDTRFKEVPPLELTLMNDITGIDEFMGRGVCNLAHLDEERTHKISLDLEDNAAIIDLFVTITETTPLQEATNDGENSANVALELIPTRLVDRDFARYKFPAILKSMVPITDIGKLEVKVYQARGISAKDLGGKSDPFCIVELDSSRLRTHTIYKTLDPAWNKAFVMPVQDIHSVLELIIFDEDTNTSNEFIGKVQIPLLAIKNGEKKWFALKDRKCIFPVKGAIQIEATFIYTNLKAVIRTINPRQIAYYQEDGKFSVGAIKQHVTRIRNMFMGIVNLGTFINHCFQWENPLLSFLTFMACLTIVWNFELYMAPCTLLLIFAWNAIAEYRQGRLGKYYCSSSDTTISAVVQPTPVEEDELAAAEANTKEEKKSFMGVIQGIQDTVLELQGHIDGVASTLERIKNLFNYSVPWLSYLLIVTLFLATILLYYVPLRPLILAFVINKFTKRFRKPKGFIDNNEAADFISRLPSDPELLQYRELKILARAPTPKKGKRAASTNK